METLWFCLVAVMVAMYVLFDGFDLGAGAVHFLVAKNVEERRQVIATIGPVWDGNEVWLLAAGGVLYFAFPLLYASGFSGFYLPLMVVLWLLIVRGTSIEFRNHIKSTAWIPFWDFAFSAASLLLAVFLGAALGNVVRGVPLDASGYFFEPLWTNFELGDNTGILDWYTIVVGVTALVALMMHGSLWVQLKTDGAVRQRAARVAAWTWWGVLILTAVLTLITFGVQPQIMANFKTWPAGLILPAIAIAGLAGVQFELRRGKELNAFLASCGYLLGMLTSVVFGVYPMVLPARNAACSLTITNAKAGDYGLKVGIIWWIIGMLLASGYFYYVYRTFSGKISANSDTYSHGD